jgi:hypothetical protein
MGKKKKEGVPALQNEAVTGMTEDKQNEAIRKSGRAPRKEAAKEFYREEGNQARQSPTPEQRPERSE